MADITTIWVPLESRGDWTLNGEQLGSGNDLVTAVYISLFTDGQANVDDVIPDGTTDRRGWWGDAGQTVAIGSRLWLLRRSILTSQVAALAQTYCLQALQWLIDDGIVASITVTTQITLPKMLGLTVQLFKQDGTTVAVNFNWAWSGIN
jgi:phage gp46-like protein